LVNNHVWSLEACVLARSNWQEDIIQRWSPL
jgi:hypothetical protein